MRTLIEALFVPDALLGWFVGHLCPSCGKERGRCWCHGT
jgi:hypothetical protein